MAVTNWVDGVKYAATKGKQYVDGKQYQTASDVTTAIAAKVKTDVPENAVFTDTVYDDTALAGRVTTVEGDITTLKGSGEGSVSKMVDDAIDDFATKITDNNVVDTFKELVDYAAENGSDLSTLTGKVTDLETAVGSKAKEADGDNPAVEASGVYKYTDDKISAAIAALDVPTVPTNVSAFTNDAGYQTASDVVTAIAGKANTSDLATVATTGSFNDLLNVPEDIQPDTTGYEAAIDAIFATS